MPYFSAFTPFGLLEFSSDDSRAEKFYKALVAAYRDRAGQMTIDTTPGTHQEAKIYGWAMALGDAWMHTDQAGRETRPETSYYTIAAHEERFQSTPAPEATIPERQDALAARQKLARGPRYEAMVDLLQTLLGSDFLAYRPITVDEAEAHPENGGEIGIYPNPELPAKVVRILGAVARVGVTVEFAYENWSQKGLDVTLGEGDRLIVDPGTWGVAEHVTIISSSGAGAARRARAVFSKPHEAGAFASTGTHPLWISTKRHVMIVLKKSAALDPTIRKRVNIALAKAMRAPTTWSIVAPNDDNENVMGPFTLGVSPLGVVPVATMPTLIGVLPPE